MSSHRFLKQHTFINFVNINRNRKLLSSRIKRYSFPLHPGYLTFGKPRMLDDPNFLLMYNKQRLTYLNENDVSNFYPLEQGKLHISIPALDYDTFIDLNKDCVISVTYDGNDDLKRIEVENEKFNYDTVFVI